MSSTLLKDVDVNGLCFAPISTKNQRTSVDLYKDSNSMHRVQVQVSKEPLVARFPLDTPVNEDALRVSQVLRIDDPSLQEVMRAWDEKVISVAMEHAKQWFKKELPEEEVRRRFKNTLYQKEDSDAWLMNIKVKLPGSAVPTKLHLCGDDRKVMMDAATVEDMRKRGCVLTPIISTQGLWFMAGGTQFGMSWQAEQIIVQPGKEASPLSLFRPPCEQSYKVLEAPGDVSGKVIDLAEEPYTLLQEVDVAALHFGPIATKNQRTSVDLFKDSATTHRVQVQMCTEPLCARFPLDTPMNEDSLRVSQVIRIDDPSLQETFRAWDERVLSVAIENARQWFKKELPEEEVRRRFKNTLYQKEDSDAWLVNIKVKLPGSAVPTKLHLCDEDSKVVLNAATVEHMRRRGCLLTPIISTQGLWFMAGGTQFGISWQAEQILVVPGKEPSPLGMFHSPEEYPYEIAMDDMDKQEEVHLAEE